MTEEISKNNTVPSRYIKSGEDYILHLGTMKNAVIIAQYVPFASAIFSGNGSWYAISPRSYFPFTEEQIEKRFDTAPQAIAFAEKIILEWLNSISISLSDDKKELI